MALLAYEEFACPLEWSQGLELNTGWVEGELSDGLLLATDFFVLDLVRDYGIFRCLGARLCPLKENKQKVIGCGWTYLEPGAEEFHDSSNKEG